MSTRAIIDSVYVAPSIRKAIEKQLQSRVMTSLCCCSYFMAVLIASRHVSEWSSSRSAFPITFTHRAWTREWNNNRQHRILNAGHRATQQLDRSLAIYRVYLSRIDLFSPIVSDDAYPCARARASVRMCARVSALYSIFSRPTSRTRASKRVETFVTH